MKNNWQAKRLDEFAYISSGNSAPQKKEYFVKGKYPFFRTSDVGRVHIGNIDKPLDYLNNEGIKGMRLFKKGTLLFPKSGASTFLNHRVLMDTDGYVSSHLATIKVNSAVLDEKFLFYFSLSVDARSLMQDQNYPSLRLSDIENIEIAIPSLPEQKRIVKILDNVFENINNAKENTKKNLQNSKELYEAYLQNLFADPGKSWTVCTIEDLFIDGIIEKIQDGNHGELHPRKSDFVDKGTPFIMASDLNEKRVDLKNCNFITDKQAASLRIGFAKNNDVLLTHKGTIGRTAILKTDMKYVILTPQVTYYRIKNNQKLFNKYLMYYFDQQTFQTELKNLAKDGSTRAYIGITKQLKLPFAYPSVLSQKTIVAKLEVLSTKTKKLEEIYRQKLFLLDELKKSFLAKAFAGKL